MPKIIKYRDYAGIRGKEIKEAEAGIKVGDAVYNSFPETFTEFIECDAFLNTTNSKPLEPEDFERHLDEDDVVYIVVRQGAGAVSQAWDFASRGLSQFFDWLIPIPDIPSYDQEDQKTSPNTSFRAKGNLSRPYQAIPELFGEGNATPDYIQPPIQSYVAHRKKFIEIYCLSVGKARVVETYQGDTKTDLVAGTTVTVHYPGSLPSNLKIYKPAEGIDREELIAPDDPARTLSGDALFAQSILVSLDRIVIFNPNGNKIEVQSGGKELYYAMDLYRYPEVNISSLGNPDNRGPHEILSVEYNSTDDTIVLYTNRTVTLEAINVSFTNDAHKTGFLDSSFLELDLKQGDTIDVTGTSSNNESFTVSGVSNITDDILGDVVRVDLVGPNLTYEETTATIEVTSDPWTEWFQLDGLGSTARILFQMPRGCRDSNENAITMQFQVRLEQVDDDGEPVIGGLFYVATISFTSNSADPRYVHYDLTVNPTVPYRARARRITSYIEDAQDFLVLENISMIENYSGANFGDVTLLEVERIATQFGTSKTSRFNVDYVRQLPDWTPDGGYDSTLSDAKNGFRAVLYQHVEAAGLPIGQMDTQWLYDKYTALGDDLGAFAWSFDDVDQSHRDRIKTILNAARIQTYRSGQYRRFFRDEAQSSVVASFDRRNIKQGSNSTIRAVRGIPGNKDSIEIRYKDKDSKDWESVFRKINRTTGAIQTFRGDNLQSITLAGCNNLAQAENRADYEIRKLLNQPITVSQDVLNDGNAVDLGDLVYWSDIQSGETMEGEVLSYSGLVFNTSERLEFESGVTYYAAITDEIGEPSNSVVVTKTGDRQFTAAASFGVTPVVATELNQLGSRYIIGSNADLAKSRFIVANKSPQGDNSVNLTLIQYKPEHYSED